MTEAFALNSSAKHHHAVQFYEDDAFLCRRVVDFVASGLRDGGPAVIIAQADHREAVAAGLRAQGFDVAKETKEGRLTLLDAEETLATFMVGESPHWDSFERVVGGVLQRAAGAKGDRVHAYGEMVDVLWRSGHRSAAVRLEELWNELAARHDFELLCAYRMGNFYKEADAGGFDEVCRTHTLVVPTEEFPAQAGDDPARLRDVSRLQQRARALEGEVEQRKHLETALRAALGEVSASESALRKSETHLKNLMENAAEGLHWVGSDGTILWANKAELEMLGYDAGEYIGQPIAKFHADGPVIADILARLSRGETLRDQEARLRHKDGTLRHVVINSSVCSHGEEFLHTSCFTRDVTKRKEAELRLAQALESAEAATKAKDEFLAMLGHELRNPLAPIATALQLVRLRGGPITREHAVIERQVKHLARLVDDLLDVARITQGRVQLCREPVEIADVIAKAVEMSSPLLEERRHRLDLDVPRNGLLRVDGDVARLAQVFCNLLSNAAKYTDPGGHISVSARRSGERLAVRVADNGAGIEPDLLPRIFDLFTQAKQTLDRSRGGLGIGLTIVRSLVELHGGKVSARSDGPARGSEFTVELPLLERAKDLADAREAVARPAGGRLRILVVDDNEDGCTLLALALRELGFQVVTAYDGPTALAAAKGFSPDVAVLDIGLPVMDGYELGRRLAAQRPGIHLVAVTGYGQESDQRRSREAGFADHLVKPVPLDTLARLLENLNREAAAQG